MRVYLSALLIAALVAGCASNPSATPQTTFVLPSLNLIAPVGTLRDLTDATPLAYLRKAPVVAILELPKIHTNQGTIGLILWGTRDPVSHAIRKITEAQVFGMGTPPASVHVYFNTAMQPMLFRDDASGYSMVISHETSTRQRVTLCDSSFNALEETTVTNANGSPQLGAVSSGGSCTIPRADVIRGFAPHAHTCKGDPASIAYQLCLLEPLITAGSYVGGLAFALTALYKFHQHKASPGQIPISKPIVLLFIAAALIFIPAIFRSSGGTIFEGDPIPVNGVAAQYVAQESLPGCSGTAPPGTCPFPHPEPTP